jgi:hypothetical protein
VVSSAVFIGIDVACGLNKKLPICVVSAVHPLTPLAIPTSLSAIIPRGVGNREIRSAAPFRETAADVVAAINLIIKEMGWTVKRIAVDAPAAAPPTGSRLSESELSSNGLSSFQTPAVPLWADIRKVSIKHLEAGGSTATLPYANKIWMLFGFELFARLRKELAAEVLEVYPFAIIRALLPSCAHKSTPEGYRDQLAAVAARTGWESLDLEVLLKATVPGNRHDRLDAFMAAWIASLPTEDRRAFGDARNVNDAIWVESLH